MDIVQTICVGVYVMDPFWNGDCRRGFRISWRRVILGFISPCAGV